jgi:hypothetical protein
MKVETKVPCTSLDDLADVPRVVCEATLVLWYFIQYLFSPLHLGLLQFWNLIIDLGTVA